MSSVSESRVLVIYTGGTIGMLSLVGGSQGGQTQGLAPEPFFLTETLRSQSRFHDPFQDSLFSHSGSVEGFRKWTANGRNSPYLRTEREHINTGRLPNIHPPISSTVRSSQPIICHPQAEYHPRDESKSSKSENEFSSPTSETTTVGYYEAELPALVTPKTQSPSGPSRRIRYTILEWQPLLDSSNMDISDWIRIATEIDLNYNLFDAFVILHGTDTMCYTSSALSFLLEDLGKTVIITGAQIPLSQLRNDAFDNFLGALWIAGHYIIPECCLFFNHKLYRGNRASKISSFDLNAFSSPNFPPLVKVGIDVVVNWRNVWRQTGQRKFHVHKSMSPEVATLRLFPGITAATIKAFLAPPVRGVVLETFGAGNAPQRADIWDAFLEACNRGVVVVAISQCVKGSVENMYKYETGRALRRAGVVPGGDMTPECVLTKLAYLLSKEDLTVGEIRSLMQESLRGEITVSHDSHIQTKPEPDHFQMVLSQIMRLAQSTRSEIGTGTDEEDLPAIDLEEPSDTQTKSFPQQNERSLLPMLVHLAVSQDDVEGLSSALGLHIKDSSQEGIDIRSDGLSNIDMINALDSISGRSPLHTAALRGAIRSTKMLLELGALVHVRDLMDHTALYYAARQGHENLVDLLLESGAHLMGADVTFLPPCIERAELQGNIAIARSCAKVKQMIWCERLSYLI